MNRDNNAMIENCGLWEGASKAGARYLSGSSMKARYMVFEMNNRMKERVPAHRLVKVPRENRDSGPQNDSGQALLGGEVSSDAKVTAPEAVVVRIGAS